MARLPLITTRNSELSPAQLAAFNSIEASRGRVLRPFEVLLHSPAIALRTAELGSEIRFGSSLSDHDRELVILTTSAFHSCEFEWNAHVPLALDAGVRPETVQHLGGQDSSASLSEVEELLIEFARELLAGSSVSTDRFERMLAHVDATGVVELCATVGYYTMLAYVMGACVAC